MTEEELKEILTKGFLGVGENYSMYEFNTYAEDENGNFIYLFKNLQNIDYIRELKNDDKESKFYLVEFEMPYSKIWKCGGKGYYTASGYDSYDWVDIKEYQIPVENMDVKYITAFVPDENRNMSAEDFKNAFEDYKKERQQDIDSNNDPLTVN